MYHQHHGQDRAIGQAQQSIITPIGALNSYSKAVSIRGRVIDRKDLRSYHNARGEGHVFSFIIMDKDQSTINIVGFNEPAIKFDPIVKVGKIYTLSNFQLRLPNRASAGTTSDYEISLDGNSQIIEQQDDQTIGQQSYKSIRNLDFVREYNTQINNQNNDMTFDFLGVVQSYEAVNHFQSKTGKQLVRRSFVFVDRTLHSTEVTLWGDMATKYDDHLFEGNPVVLLKGVRINEYNQQKSLQSSFSTSLTFNSQDDRCREIRRWYDEHGKHSQFTPLGRGGSTQSTSSSSRYRLDHLTDVDEGRVMYSDKAQFVNIVGYISQLRINAERPPWYLACPGENCKRKVSGEDGQYFCQKCNLTYPNCLYRYILNFSLTDDTSTRSLTAFHDDAVGILKMEPHELKEVMDTQDLEEFIRNFMYRQLDLLVAAQGDVNPNAIDGDGRSVRYRVTRTNPLDHSRVSKMALAEINHLREIADIK